MITGLAYSILSEQNVRMPKNLDYVGHWYFINGCTNFYKTQNSFKVRFKIFMCFFFIKAT